MARYPTMREGLVVSCNIRGSKVERALVTFENGHCYLCQNIESGSSCSDKHGYMYSYQVGRGDESGFLNNSVEDVVVMTNSLQDAQVGIVLLNPAGKEERVIARLEDILFLSLTSNKGYCGHHGTWKQLTAEGYTVKPWEELIEVNIMKNGKKITEAITAEQAKELGIIA